MRRLLFAIALLVFGGITFTAGTPARAIEAGTLSDIGIAVPAGKITKAQWPHHHHHHWRHRHWGPYWGPRCRRYCRWYYGYWRCYRRCWW